MEAVRLSSSGRRASKPNIWVSPKPFLAKSISELMAGSSEVPAAIDLMRADMSLSSCVRSFVDCAPQLCKGVKLSPVDDGHGALLLPVLRLALRLLEARITCSRESAYSGKLVRRDNWV
jgi:hypothetical protein